MAEVVRMPTEMVAELARAPWAKAMEALTPTLPYDLAVTAGGVPAAELAPQLAMSPDGRTLAVSRSLVNHEIIDVHVSLGDIRFYDTRTRRSNEHR